MHTRTSRALLTLLLIALLTLAGHAQEDSVPPGFALLWQPIEWEEDVDIYLENPFDIEAEVTFTHQESGEERRTFMYYKGADTWGFRFTGTRVGEWRYRTSSEEGDLDGLDGVIYVAENPDPDAKGFLTHVGNQFAIQTGSNGELSAHVFTVYMNLMDEKPELEPSIYRGRRYIFEELLTEAEEQGFNTVFMPINHSWLQLGAATSADHTSTEPDLETFALLDRLLEIARSRNMRIHFWMWGDESSGLTPTDLSGGINGEVDTRLQRYIAARLGAVPGWSMTYGYNLLSWVTEFQVNQWAQTINDRSFWPHMLFARGYASGQLTGRSYSSTDAPVRTSYGGPLSYDEIVEDFNSDTTRPHFYERRFTYESTLGEGTWTMDTTRRTLWWTMMAGGVGSFWGYRAEGPGPYPNPEQLATFHRFWEDRYTLGMRRVNNLTNGYGIASESGDTLIFYGDETSSFNLNLDGVGRQFNLIAVDTRLEYAELDQGVIEPVNQTWEAPYASDWALVLTSVQ